MVILWSVSRNSALSKAPCLLHFYIQKNKQQKNCEGHSASCWQLPTTGVGVHTTNLNSRHKNSFCSFLSQFAGVPVLSQARMREEEPALRNPTAAVSSSWGVGGQGCCSCREWPVWTDVLPHTYMQENKVGRKDWWWQIRTWEYFFTLNYGKIIMQARKVISFLFCLLCLLAGCMKFFKKGEIMPKCGSSPPQTEVALPGSTTSSCMHETGLLRNQSVSNWLSSQSSH